MNDNLAQCIEDSSNSECILKWGKPATISWEYLGGPTPIALSHGFAQELCPIPPMCTQQHLTYKTPDTIIHAIPTCLLCSSFNFFNRNQFFFVSFLKSTGQQSSTPQNEGIGRSFVTVLPLFATRITLIRLP